jgi:hypothetical protein
VQLNLSWRACRMRPIAARLIEPAVFAGSARVEIEGSVLAFSTDNPHVN